MRKTLLLVFSCVLISGAFAEPMQMRVQPRALRLRPLTVVVLPDRMTPRFTALAARLTPRGSAWVEGETQRLLRGQFEPSAVRDHATNMCGSTAASCIAGGDIEALCFIVMMQAASDAQQDLKDIMDDVKKINKTKAAMRTFQQRRAAISAEQLNRDAAQLKNDLDSMSELGETDSLRLQMAMDRLSKFMTTLSNIEQKASDTDRSITGNMK